MSAARFLFASAVVCACVAALPACKREVPHVREDDEPAPVALTEEPPPSGPPAFSGAPPAPNRAPMAVGAAAPGSRRAGDHVRVRWHGTCYAARILRPNGAGAYLITYDGYNHSCDETVGESRICK
jgi:hypothetical protein